MSTKGTESFVYKIHHCYYAYPAFKPDLSKAENFRGGKISRRKTFEAENFPAIYFFNRIRYKFTERSIISKYRTRYHGAMRIPKVRLEYAKRSFYFSGVKNRNDIPHENEMRAVRKCRAAKNGNTLYFSWLAIFHLVETGLQAEKFRGRKISSDLNG